MIKKIAFIVLLLGLQQNLHAQGIHFSQYYNAPLLLNPANTGLMSQEDYRLGINYRDQWSSVPVPFKTMSAYGDLQVFRNGNGTNWLGLGFAYFNDVAGDGKLSLNKADLSIAYHVQTGEFVMISAGFSAASVGRSVDYNKLTFDLQWDGFTFDKNLANGEQINVIKTSFIDMAAGINFAYFPNEAVYIKLGGGVAHINNPKETFYNLTNQMGMRPIGNLDARLILNETFTLNPSVYYSSERGASEILAGTLAYVNIGGSKNADFSLIVGAHYRVKEAIVASIGMQWGGLRIMSSYDYTTSSVGVDTKGKGALEFGLVYQGKYGERLHSAKNMNCPRFY